MEGEPLLPRDAAEPRLRASTRIVLAGALVLGALTVALRPGNSVVVQNLLARPAPSAPSAGWPWRRTETPAPSPTPSWRQDDGSWPIPNPTAQESPHPVPAPTASSLMSSVLTASPTPLQTAPQQQALSPQPTVVEDTRWRMTNPPTAHALPTPSPTKAQYAWNWTYAPTGIMPPAPTPGLMMGGPGDDQATAAPTRLATPSETPTLRPSSEIPAYTRPAGGDGAGGFNASARGAGRLVSPLDDDGDGDASSSPVHIVYVIGDDIGWNDVGWQSTDFGPDSLPLGGATPTLDALATSGVILDRFYAMPQCTPSRTSLLSGVHPMHTGMYVTSINPATPFALPLHFRILPEYLKMANSATCAHGIGKWDVGHYHWRYLPVQRGFDSWYGYYNSFTSYLSHIGSFGLCTDGVDCFTDFNEDGRSLAHEAGKYSTRLFTEQAEKVISAHDAAAPLFLYFAPTNCHGNVVVPVQLMEEHSSTISGVPNHARRIYASCVMSLDGAVTRLEGALRDAGQ